MTTRTGFRYRVAPEELVCLQQRLLSELGSRGSDVTLAASGEGCVLRGTTRTYYSKQLAQEHYLAISPYPLLANDIEVQFVPESEGEAAVDSGPATVEENV